MAASDAPNNDAWFVAADGKSYGPYTEDQLKAFIGEGRVGPATPVMRPGERWALASEHSGLAWIFATRPAGTPALGPAQASSPSSTASASAPMPVAPSNEPAHAGPAHGPDLVQVLAKVVIVADLRSGSTIAFENAVAKLGQSYRMNQFVWLVHTPLSIPQMRKELVPFAGRLDPIFIADTTHGRAAWINFGPGAEATIKALWRGGA